MPDFPANPIIKPGYMLEWNDEFESAELDTQKWFPYHLPHWSSKERSRANFILRDGAIVLKIGESQEPWSPEFDGGIKASTLQSGVYSGPVGSRIGQLQFARHLIVREAQQNLRLYTPQYGYFECRAKCCANTQTHVSLWMVGYEEQPDQSGEIAMFEVFGKDANKNSGIVCYGIHPWADATLIDEFYQDKLVMDVTDFHIYACEWLPSHVDFYIDNRHLRRINQSPNYPLQIMLSIFERPTEPRDKTIPKDFEVDYVRVYQRSGL